MQKHELSLVMLLTMMLLTTTGARAEQDPWQARTFHASNGLELPYRLLVPLHQPSPRPQPMVLFLHGAGERGNDNVSQLKNGVRELFATPSVRRRLPALVVVPQCPEGQRWVAVDWNAPAHTMPLSPSRPMAAVMELLDALQQEFSVDPTRRYVLGISMGGFGTWDLLARRPGSFAAAVPICGGADVATAPRLASVPLWVFHGSEDTVVPVGRSRSMVEALEKAGGTPRYTEYARTGHDSWTRALAESGLLPWLFDQGSRR